MVNISNQRILNTLEHLVHLGAKGVETRETIATNMYPVYSYSLSN